jgi:flagella synthesis protein FlgN
MHTFGTTPASELDQECNTTRNLLQLLKQEQACLVDANIDELIRVTEEKGKVAMHMAELANNRHRLLSAAGFEAAESGMQAWLECPAATDADRGMWKELLDLADSGKELNRVNGMLIAQHMSLNQSALNVLQGTPEGSSIYGPNGQSATKIGSRRLVVG